MGNRFHFNELDGTNVNSIANLFSQLLSSGANININFISSGDTITNTNTNTNCNNTDNSSRTKVKNSYKNSHNTDNHNKSYNNVGNTNHINSHNTSNIGMCNAETDVWGLIADMCGGKKKGIWIDGEAYEVNPNKRKITHIPYEGDNDGNTSNLGETIKSLLLDGLTLGTACGMAYLDRRKNK